MRHQVLQDIGPLKGASDEALEQAVDVLVSEEQFTMASIKEQIARAEALAILAHEFRRREK